MTYAKSLLMFDADSHVMETPDWVERHVDPKFRNRLSPLGLGAAGGATYQLIEDAVERARARAASAARIEHVIAGPKGWYAPGAIDPLERSQALDDLGFARQVVFSTFAATQYLGHKDLDVRYAGLRAHNRAMGEFCQHDTRLVGVAQLSLAAPERAVEEIEAAVRVGCGAFWIPAAPVDARSPGHREFDPVWAALCDADKPFLLHVGPNSRHVSKAYLNNGEPLPPDIIGGGENLRVRDFMALSFAPQMFLTALVFDGVFERFPALRGGVIELGAGWVPQFLRTLDMSQTLFKRTDPQVARLRKRASEYIRSQVRFTPYAGEDLAALFAETGPELYMFSSDYPHPEGGNDPLARFERALEGVSEAARAQFYRGNFAYLFGATGYPEELTTREIARAPSAEPEQSESA